jgi:predicted histidine transporter YuiF (NhaC family)
MDKERMCVRALIVLLVFTIGLGVISYIQAGHVVTNGVIMCGIGALVTCAALGFLMVAVALEYRIKQSTVMLMQAILDPTNFKVSVRKAKQSSKEDNHEDSSNG